MTENDSAFYEQVLRRIGWMIACLGLLGAAVLTFSRGTRFGSAFLIGAAFSYLSFWGWQQIVNALGASPKKRSSWMFTFRIIALAALACAIIKLLGLNVAAAVSGLLVSGAAVILELIYELIYART